MYAVTILQFQNFSIPLPVPVLEFESLFLPVLFQYFSFKKITRTRILTSEISRTRIPPVPVPVASHDYELNVSVV